YESVERHIDQEGYIFFMAKPLKALVDYIYINKIDFDSVDFLLNNLRIDKEELTNLQNRDFNLLAANYGNKQVNQFIGKIKKELDK
ncbi:MAG: hypothetical protein J7L71_06150, partial [Spirochaetaceae bacterium]|nr:hypothetical protein [Spirochaetaceae bacterium]